MRKTHRNDSLQGPSNIYYRLSSSEKRALMYRYRIDSPLSTD